MRKSTSDYIYDSIKNDLLKGDLDFGDKIIETEYSIKLNISRTPLREAIKKLENEGIIERLSNGRLRIMEINSEKLDEICSIRICLEGILFDSIVDNREGIDKILQNLSLTKYLIDLENWSEARRLFSEYNSLLYSMSTLEYTVKTLKYFDFINSVLRRKALRDSDTIIEAYKEHLEIMTLLQENQVEKAKEANKAHLLNTKEIVKKIL